MHALNSLLITQEEIQDGGEFLATRKRGTIPKKFRNRPRNFQGSRAFAGLPDKVSLFLGGHIFGTFNGASLPSLACDPFGTSSVSCPRVLPHLRLLGCLWTGACGQKSRQACQGQHRFRLGYPVRPGPGNVTEANISEIAY